MLVKDRNRKYIHWGITAFLVVLASIVSFVVLSNLPGFFAVISDLLRVLSPILIGVIFAYLLNPLVKLFEQVVVTRMLNKSKNPVRTKKVGRALAILFAFLIAGVILYGLFYMVLPKLYNTIARLVLSLPTNFEKARLWILDVVRDNDVLKESVEAVLDRLYLRVEKLLSEDLVSNLQAVMVGMTNFSKAVIRTLFDIIIGLVASIYMLWSKERFQANAKKLVVAAFRPKTADWFLRLGREAHRIFSGFVVGKIIDSILIGILCYIGMLILRLPYPELISAVVGTANLIPLFGPIIGAIPCALLILIDSPLQALYFVIFDIVLQQLDGNVIGPKVLGDSIGLSGFWVLFSITLFGNLFGVIGMLLGVPFFAMIYIIAQDITKAALAKKGRPQDSDAYYSLESVDQLPALEVAQSEDETPPEKAEEDTPPEEKTDTEK